MSAMPLTRATGVVTLTVRVEGSEIPKAVAILGTEIICQANRIPYARLRIGDGDAARGDFARSSGELFVPGNKIELSAGYSGDTAAIFSGRIVSQRLVVRTGTSWLEVECRDPTFAMTLIRRNRYHEDLTDSAVAEALLSEYKEQGIGAGTIAASNVTHPQLLQYQASDWDFMISRLETAGQLCFVQGGTVRSVKPSLSEPAVADIGFGATVLELDAELDARTQTGGVRAVAWDPAGQALHEATAADPSWAGNGNLSATKLSNATGRKEDLIWHGGSLDTEALQSWADGALLRARMAASRGRVRFQGLSDISAGSVLQLSRLSDRFNGKVFVTGVRHEFVDGNWTTDAEFGMPRDLHAERVAMSHVPAAGVVAAVHGLQVGIVTAIADDPGNENRIRVKVPLAGMDQDGVWARVATLDAGKERGTFFRPAKDDEVVLGYFHGDPGQPVVLGMLHSSARKPPFEPTAKNNEKGYVSASGIALKFDDDKKVVTLETPGGNRLTLSDDAGGILIEDQNGNTIKMDQDGIAIESAKKDVQLTAKKDFKLDAMMVDLQASAGLTAKGASKAEISSSGSLTVKGSMVMIN